MREIKFRGCRADNDEYVYGSYYYENHPDFGEIHSIVDDYGRRTSVDPETVAQLIGHDSNGREVYEGDTCIDEAGNEYTATLDLVIAWTDEKTGALQTISIDNAKRFTKLTLVEAIA